jgi:hypothetical protein
MVYIEDKCSDNGKFEMNMWLLNDNRIIDSLKNEYTCALNKQGDGESEFQVYLFKDHIHNDWNLFNNQKNMSLGKLKSQLVPVRNTYRHCPNWYATKILTDSLAKQGKIFTISPADTAYKRMNEFAVKFTLGVNRSSQLLHGDTRLNDWLNVAKKEIARLFPELTIQDFSFNGDSDYIESNAPGDTNAENQPVKNKELKVILTNNKAFQLEISRLKNTDLFSNYNVCTLYTVTIYEQKNIAR